MQNGKKSLFNRGSGFGAALGPGRPGGAGSCIRSLRWAMPILVAAVLSSYATYLLLYPGRLHQHAAQHDGGSGLWGFHGGTSQRAGDSSSSSSATSSNSQAALVGTHRYAPQDAAFQWVTAAGRRMRVAVVNEAPYHLEIVAGLLQVLNQMPVDVTWYQASQTTADGTLTPTELLEVTGFTQLLGYLPQMKPSSAVPALCDYAILVSPEYFLQATKVRLRHDWLAAGAWLGSAAAPAFQTCGTLRQAAALHALYLCMCCVCIQVHVRLSLQHSRHLVAPYTLVFVYGGSSYSAGCGPTPW
jgi:hypothetical protein